MALWEADGFEPLDAGGTGSVTNSADGSATGMASAIGTTSATGAIDTTNKANTTNKVDATRATKKAKTTGTSAPSHTLTPELTEYDLGVDRSLRPRKLDDYIGQTRVKENLAVLIEAARQRRDVLDHLLFSGPPGLGKTTLSAVVANELGVSLKATSGPAIERSGDLAAILTNLEEGDVLFIDEIHRLNRVIEEVLYPAMEDFVLDIVIGKGPAAQSLRLDIPHFTLIGATTRTGLLTGPLRDRFGIAFRLDYYNERELHDIVVRSATILDVTIDKGGAFEISRRSRGTPRLANRLLRRVRDFAAVKANHEITMDVAREALAFFEVDELGLDTMDNKILDVLVTTFGGRPVGLTTLANALGEDAESLEDVYEPYLLQQGLIQRTPKGRIATQRAFQHRGVPFDLPG
jgi:Holliday junction DNA helicase RuvB